MYASRRLLCTQTAGDDAQKKTTTYKEQDPAKVTHYLTQLAEFFDYQRVYLDETGFDRYLFRPYARSLKGQIVKAQISGKRYSGLNLNQDKATKPQTVQIVRQGEATPYWFKVDPLYQRLSLVSAQVGNRLIAPMVYQNTMTGVFFEAWFQQCLLPALTQKSVIILDNARFHRMGVLRKMAEKWGHKVLPLAPYSPEINPIEKVWENIKRYLRTVLSDYARFDDALLSYFDFN